MSKVRKVTILSIGRGINVLVSLLFIPFMARAFDYEGYGSYGQAVLVVSFVAAVMSMGLSSIIFVHLQEHEKEGIVFSTNVMGAFTLGLLGVLFLMITSGFFASQFHNPDLAYFLRIYSLSLLFTIPVQSIMSYLIHKNEIKKNALLLVLGNALKIAFVVLVIQLYHSVSLALWAYVGSQLLQMVLGMYYVRSDLSTQVDKALFTDQIKRGFPLGLTGLIGTAILYTDGFMVSKMKGVVNFAIYRNGALEVPFISTLYVAVSAIVLPEVARLFKAKDFNEILRLKKKVIMNTMMITYPILIFLLFNSESIIVLYLGEKYHASAIIFLVFNLTLLVRVNDYADILISSNNGKYILYYYVAIFILNITLNHILIQYYGVVGAAISTVFSVLVVSLLQLNKSLTIIGSTFNELIDFKSLFTLLLLCISMAMSLHFFLIQYLDGLWRLTIFGTVYFSVVYLFLFRRKMISPDVLQKLLPKKIFRLLYGI